MSETKPVTLVQIAVASSEQGLPDVVYGLTSDGRVWRLAVKLDHTWQPLPLLIVPEQEPAA